MRDRPPELMAALRLTPGADWRSSPDRGAGRPRQGPGVFPAALALAGILTAGSGVVLATPALAQNEPDQVIEGTENPNFGAPGDSADDPDFNPGGEDNPGAVHEEDGMGDLDELAPGGTSPQGPSLHRPEEAPAPLSPQTPTPSPQTPTAGSPPGEHATPGAPHAPRRGARTPDPSGRPRARRRARPSPKLAPPPPPAHQAQPVRPQTEVALSAPAARTPRAHEGHVHVVRAGESLWAIAAEALGPDAGPQLVAREVDHLWETNKGAIGTGSPDMLHIGTRLRVP